MGIVDESDSPPIPGTNTDLPANGTDSVMLVTGNVEGDGTPAPNYTISVTTQDERDCMLTLIIPGISKYGRSSLS